MCDERYVSHMVAMDGDGREADFLILLILRSFLTLKYSSKPHRRNRAKAVAVSVWVVVAPSAVSYLTTL